MGEDAVRNRPMLEPGETIISLELGGRVVFGLMHRPESWTSRTGVLFLSAGQQNRAGPTRLYVRAARALSQQGILSVRMDMPGVGDSEGELDFKHFDCHDPESVIGLIDYLFERIDLDRLVLLGLCAGARLAIKAAARDPRVSAVVAWGLPVASNSPNMPPSPEALTNTVSDAAARSVARHWISRTLRPSAWRRYLSNGESLRERVRSIRSVAGGLVSGARVVDPPSSSVFLDSLEEFLGSSRKALFVYGERDRLPLAEFRERYGAITEGLDPNRSFVVIPNGTHTFTPAQAATTLISDTAKWISALRSST